MVRMENASNNSQTVTLKTVAEYVGLAMGTVSKVLNQAPSSEAIPQPTQERIFAAARRLNYRPNFFAQSLRTRRTHTIGIIAHDLGDPYGALMTAGIEQFLRPQGYSFLIGAHGHDSAWLERYAATLSQRGAEGLITMNPPMPHSLPLPTVAVDVAAFRHRSLSTARSLLQRLGEAAARTLLARIEDYRDCHASRVVDRPALPLAWRLSEHPEWNESAEGGAATECLGSEGGNDFS